MNNKMEKGISFKTYFEVIKAVIFIVVALLIAYSAFQGFTWLNNKVDTQKQEYAMQLEAQRQKFELEINQVRAQTSVVINNSSEWKNELAKLKKENADMVALIKQNGEKITNIGEVNTKYNEQLSADLKKATEHAYMAGTGDVNEQYFTKIFAKEKDAAGNVVQLPVGWSTFYPNKPESEQWKTGAYAIEYKTKVVQAEQKDGQINTYLESWAENNKDKDSVGVKLPLDIQLAEFTQVKIEDKEFQWWSPHINLNIDTGFSTALESKVGAGLSFSLSGYGKTVNDLTWKFLDFGLSTNGKDYFGKFAPFGYNIGDRIPLISNTFLSPFIGYEFKNGSTIGGLSISVPF